MKQRLLTAFLAVVMLLAAIPTVRAAGFTDIDNHWAKDYIEQAVALGLFSGVSEDRFAPDATMTRGMFVTVLGRLEGVDAEYWSSESIPQFFSDVDVNMYYSPYIRWAVCNGIADGTGYNTFSPNAPVTREQMAKLVAYYIQKMKHGLQLPDISQPVPEAFADESSISSWALNSVNILHTLGILGGMANENGEIYFKPANKLTRAECAAVFCRLKESMVASNPNLVVQPTSIWLDQVTLTLKPSETAVLTATLMPSNLSAEGLLWRTSDPKVATVENGVVTAKGIGLASIMVCTSNGLFATCLVECSEPTLAHASETYNERCMRIFGEVVNDPRMYYSRPTEGGGYVMDYEAAKADMVELTVRVWDFDSQGNKVTKLMSVEIHRNIAPTVEMIFEEIYNGEEKFPIYYIGGFSHGGRSEHTIGCAIDLNPNENYYYNPNTGQQVGNYWKPGEDPYSIPLDGEVARIFAKYGFTQGVNWNSGAKDYMHFSYFGT